MNISKVKLNSKIMKRFVYAALCVVSLCLSGCGYDDDEVWNAINDQEERIAALEEWQKTANENIAALQAIVNGNDYITSVEEIKEGDEIIGYTINFHRQGEVTIYNGKDGEKGDMPVISVTEGEDGRWYWTVNGELLEDANGNPVCASGKDGEDGEDGEDGQDGQDGTSSSCVTPIVKLGSELGVTYNDYAYYLSVDNEKTWIQLTVPVGISGSNLISISDEGSYYVFHIGQFYEGGSSTGYLNIPKYDLNELPFLNYTVKDEGDTEWDNIGFISDGKMNVEAGKIYCINAILEYEGTLSAKIIEGEEEKWGIDIVENVDVSGNQYVGVMIEDVPEEASSMTVLFTIVKTNNQATFYQVTVTVTEEEESKIEAETNPELIAVLQSQNIGTTNTDGDLVLTQEMIDGIVFLDLSYENLKDLEGLEVFANLTALDCSNNQISELDLTQLPNLTSLNCSGNPLLSLNTEALPQLMYLYCNNCFGQSQSRSYVDGTLDLSENKQLIVLSCDENQLSNLILPETSTLVDIYCSDNNLKILDVSKNTGLSQFHCSRNQLIELKLPKTQTLKEVWCNDNKLTSLDVSGNTTLERLTCHDNDLDELDISTNTGLQILECQVNQLKTLDISKNISLTALYVGFNSLSDINVSMNKALESLSCEYNQLTKLDVSPCENLKYLYCSSNQLLTLDISKNTKLISITCGYQHNVDDVEQVLSLVVNETQKELWENDWSSYNEYVKIVEGAVNVSGGNGNNFGNGGVY